MSTQTATTADADTDFTPQATVAISLTVKRGAEALDFYARAFGAKENFRFTRPDGGLGHAEFTIGNTRLFISDEFPEWHARALPEGTNASCLFSITTEDCDQAFARAVEAGAAALMEPATQFWGSRSAMVRDPYGYRWSFSQKIENLSLEEIHERAKQ